MNGVGEEVTTLRVKPKGVMKELFNATTRGPPDFLLLDITSVKSKKAKKELMNTTLSYAFQVRIRFFNSSLFTYFGLLFFRARFATCRR